MAAPACPIRAARRFAPVSGGSNVTSFHTFRGRATTAVVASTALPPIRSTSTPVPVCRIRTAARPWRMSPASAASASISDAVPFSKLSPISVNASSKR